MSDKVCISWCHQECEHGKQICTCGICVCEKSQCILVDRNHFAAVPTTNVEEEINTPIIYTRLDPDVYSPQPILEIYLDGIQP